MKKLPKSVTVFGRKIPVHTLSSEEIKRLYPDFTNAPQGLWDAGSREIIINSDFHLKDQRYTLLHEISHAVNTFNGIDLIIHPDIIEILVQSNATLLEDVLEQAQILK